MVKNYSWNEVFEEFTSYLRDVKRRAEGTIKLYMGDLLGLLSTKSFRDYASLVEEIDKGVRLICENEDLKPNTKARKSSTVNTFLGFLKETGKIKEAPVYSYKRAERVSPAPITEEQFGDLMEGIPRTNYKSARDRAIFALMFYTGIRESETVKLEDKDFEAEEGKMYVNITFGDSYKRRRLEVPKQAIREIKAYKTLYSTHPTRENKPSLESETFFKNIRGKKISTRSVRRKLEKWTARAGVDASLMSLVYGYANRQISEGTTPKQLASLMGILPTQTRELVELLKR